MPDNWSKTFGSLIFKLRTEKKLPLRKVAAALDIDTSTLSKIEKGERQANLDMIPVVAKFFKLDAKDLQVEVLSEKILNEYGKEEFFSDALSATLKKAKQKPSKSSRSKKQTNIQTA